MIWMDMRSRCNNPNNQAFHNYGGRGIKVCQGWDSFENFLRDMGERPEGLTLDRWPDNNGDYCPSNCRWATYKQQQRGRRNNRLVTAFGETRTLSEWAEERDLKAGTLRHRLERGLTPEQALEKSLPNGHVGYCEKMKTKKWRAQKQIAGRLMHIGYFETFDEAVAALEKFVNGDSFAVRQTD